VLAIAGGGGGGRGLGKRDHRAGAVTPSSRAIVFLGELFVQVEGKGSE